MKTSLRKDLGHPAAKKWNDVLSLKSVIFREGLHLGIGAVYTDGALFGVCDPDHPYACHEPIGHFLSHLVDRIVR